jgi:hypothetical protein
MISINSDFYQTQPEINQDIKSVFAKEKINKLFKIPYSIFSFISNVLPVSE